MLRSLFKQVSTLDVVNVQVGDGSYSVPFCTRRHLPDDLMMFMSTCAADGVCSVWDTRGGSDSRSRACAFASVSNPLQCVCES